MKQDQNIEQGRAERAQSPVFEKNRERRENWILFGFAGLVMAAIGFQAGFEGLNRAGWLCFSVVCFWRGVKE